MLSFAAPWFFLLLFVPPLLQRLLAPYRQSRAGVAVPFLEQVGRLTNQTPGPGAVVAHPPLVQRAFLWLAWGGVVCALARPQWLEPPVVKTIPTRDLLLAVDLSGSMETEDFTDAQGKKVTRLTAVKEVLDDFLTHRKGDRVGLIFFGSAAFVQAPFTEDLEACRSLLDEAQPRMAGPKTAFGDAIGLAITLFTEEESVRDRVLIALTDGNDTGSQVPPARAAEIAHERQIVIHTVAVGDPTAAGEEKLDEQALKDVAAVTGGRYARAEDRKSLAEIYGQLDALRTRPLETVTNRPRLDRFQWPLGAVVLLTLGYHLAWAVRTQALFRMTGPRAIATTALLPISISLGDFHFLRPWWFLALAPAIALFLIMRRRHDPARPWQGIIDAKLLPHLMRNEETGVGIRPEHGLLAVLSLSSLALAGPTWRRIPDPFMKDEAACVIVVKVTPSMLAQDVQPTRLARAAQKIHDLLEGRPGTSSALVAYAGSAHLVLPMTRDSHLVSRFATELSPEIMPIEGDAPADALALAATQIRKSGLPGSIVLLVDSIPSDATSPLEKLRGENEAPVQILALAAPAGAPISPEGPPAPALDLAALQRSAAALEARLTVVTPDDADVQSLIRHTTTRLVAAKQQDSGTRWEDEGYWLVFVVAACGLPWFRPGWLVTWE